MSKALRIATDEMKFSDKQKNKQKGSRDIVDDFLKRVQCSRECFRLSRCERMNLVNDKKNEKGEGIYDVCNIEHMNLMLCLKSQFK